MGLGGLAFLGELVPLIEERQPAGELIEGELVTNIDIAGGALPEVLVEAAGEIRRGQRRPGALAGGRLSG